MKREFIEGMKCLGRIGSILLQGALESMANTYEENKEYQSYKEEDLEQRWRNELYYYSDAKLNEELKKCMLYNWSVEYDGRCKCIDRIAEYNSQKGYKVV